MIGCGSSNTERKTVRCRLRRAGQRLRARGEDTFLATARQSRKGEGPRYGTRVQYCR
jgi:hypothetical protein